MLCAGEPNLSAAAQSPAVPKPRIRSQNREVARLFDYARQVATTPYSVLLEGETGTGKELFARTIHRQSGRTGPFIPLNCSAVPDNMFEAELFGAAAGAYTGLERERPGLFRLADKGTIFFDEVADLPEGMQAKLLRVLEDGEIRSLGSSATITVNVRVIAASHKTLGNLAQSGDFRRDLFFRLGGVCLRLPPLRERPEDIPTLIGDAIIEACRAQGVSDRRLDSLAMPTLLAYPWPGNIRELKNTMAVAVLNAAGEKIALADLPEEIRQLSPGLPRPRPQSMPPFFEALAAFERDYIAELLDRAEGNLSRAATLSGMSRGSVRNKARHHGLLAGGGPTPQPRSRVRLPRRAAEATKA